MGLMIFTRSLYFLSELEASLLDRMLLLWIGEYLEQFVEQRRIDV